jgi:hypothetical protein
MDMIFADDARQKRPSRSNTGPLVATGGIHVPGEAAGDLERAISAHCDSTGFPTDQQFKWSPGKRDSFMRTELVEDARLLFYEQLFAVVADHGVTAFVVVEDSSRGLAAHGSSSHEEDVTTLFLERADWCVSQKGKDGLVVVATPGGGKAEKDKFLSHCLALRTEGTGYSHLERLPLGVVTHDSRRLRTLQLADVIASCVTARVAGERTYSPAVFEMIKPLLRRDAGRIGGVGLKIHPDFVFANLYYWLLNDDVHLKGTAGWPLPMEDRPFHSDAGEAAS